jgi:hypothetical protein
MVVGTVNKNDVNAGRAILTCHYCGQKISLGPPEPFVSLLLDPLKSFPYELMIMVVLTAYLYPYATEHLHIDPKYVIGLLAVPYAVAISLGLRRFIRNEWGKMGRLRLPRRPRGTTIKTAIPVHSVHEEYHFLDLQRCPACKEGRLEVEEHAIISKSSLRLFLSAFLGREFIKLCDKITVECERCDKRFDYYFNIDQIPYIRDLGGLEELVMTHLNLAKEEQKLRGK